MEGKRGKGGGKTENVMMIKNESLIFLGQYKYFISHSLPQLNNYTTRS